MRVSVIICAYNIEKYIGKCIDSILKQNFDDYEIIIVNDGSTDNTLGIIRRLEKENQIIKVIDQSNRGSIEARKSGLDIAEGKYILFVDGDDWIKNITLKILYEKAEKNNADIVLYNGYWEFDDHIKVLRSFNKNEDIKNEPLACLFMNHINPGIVFKFIKREYLISNNIEFPSEISFAEDLATSSNLFMYEPIIDTVDESLYYYYQRKSSISRVFSDKHLEVEKSISFIKKQLIANGLYNSYKLEFERMVYTHMFSERILGSIELNNLHYQLYKMYKKMHINYKKNKYLKELINDKRFIDRIRIKIYLNNFYLGKWYDITKKLIKNNLINRRLMIRGDSQ